MEEPKYIVGIGASAGGLEALQDLFQATPNKGNMAFVIIQHLSPDFESLMGDLLKKYTKLSIQTPSKPEVIKTNTIYLIPSNKNLIYEEGKLVPINKDPHQKLNLPIDTFLQSLGEGAQDRSVGMILSGTGTDGSRGIKYIKENDGLVMVQEPNSAKFDGMPRASIKVGIADIIESPKALGNVLGRLQTESFSKIAQTFDPHAFNSNEYFQNILQLLRDRIQIDFTQYRPQTLIRRTRNRMQITNSRSLKEYFGLLKNSEEEVIRLYSDFLIGVTKFFRDPKAWECLEKKAIPHLINHAAPAGAIRVWSVGTSTGEEAFTVAMLLDRAIKKSKKNISFKVFATDASRTAIDLASKGVYNDNISVDVPETLLNEYFTKKDHTYVVSKNLRQKLIFSQHDALQDPPIIGVDLIICRNFLIYLNPSIQQSLLTSFQFSMRHKGFLFLGISENVGQMHDVFTSSNKAYKLFQNALEQKILPQKKYRQHTAIPYDGKLLYSRKEESRKKQNEDFFKDKLLSRFSVISLFVNQELEVLYTMGNLDEFFKLPSGLIHGLSLLDMAEKKNALVLRNGVRTALKRKEAIAYEEMEFVKGSTTKSVILSFSPYWFEETQEKIVLITIEEKSKEIKTKEHKKLSKVEIDHIEVLESEIKELKFELQKTKEELEAANEELQASNEELLGANEELQSSNEELQSVNEELYAVNNEFQVKINQLSELNDDINILFKNIDNAVIFLDKDLKLRKITPLVEKLFNFTSADIGRPIHHFSFWLENYGVSSLSESVINNLNEHESRVTDPTGKVHLLRILPYKTSENRIDGVVISLTEITEIIERQNTIELQEKLLTQAVDLAKMIAWSYQPEKREIHFQQPVETLIPNSLKKRKTTLNDFAKLFTKESREKLKVAFTNLLNGKQNISLVLDGKNDQVFAFKGVHQPNEEGKPLLYGAFQDVTEEHQFNEKYRSILETSLDGFFIANTETLAIIEANDSFMEMTGYSRKELLNLKIFDIDYLEQKQDSHDRMKKILQGGKGEFETVHVRKDGSLFDAKIKTQVLGESSKEVVVFVEDITERITREKELRKANHELKKTNSELDTFVYRISHDLRAPLASSLGLIELMKMETLSENLDEMVNLQARSLDSMDKFIKDILDYSRNARLDPKKEKVDFRQEVSKTLDMLSHLDNYAEVEKRISVSCKAQFKIDIFRFEVILNNLISNAIRFADLEKENPFIEVLITCTPKAMKLVVADNGMGIEKEYREKIFDMFFRATEEVEGTGIGLYILKDSLEKLKGKITVASEIGKGSTFTVTIPNSNPRKSE